MSLERAVERRTHVAAAFSAAGFTFEFFDAVDGSALTEADRSRYSHWRAVFETGDGLARGMLGCSLSHLRLYERMVSSGIPVVAVFEDDVEPLPELKAVLESLDRLPSDWQVVTLHSIFTWSEPSPIPGPPIVGDRRVCTYGRTPLGTQGYVISLGGAQRALEVGYPVAMPPDELLFRRRPAGLVRYGIEPAVIVHCEVESEIVKRGERVRARRTASRALDWCVAAAGRLRRRAQRHLDRTG